MLSYLRKRAWLALALCAACGTSPDTRPETADYIIVSILAPACGRGGCHSTETAAHGYAFDTIAGAKAAMNGTGKHGQTLVVASDSSSSELYTILLSTDEPMPADAPLPDVDIELIKNWIDDGAEGL